MIKNGTLFYWSEKLETGIPSIDFQHKKLVEILNSVFARVISLDDHETLAKYFDELEEYRKTHFAYEEELMDKYGWEKKEEHKMLHAYIVDRLHSLRQAYEKAQDMQAALILLEFLKGWLEHHICEDDFEYVKFLKEKGVK